MVFDVVDDGEEGSVRDTDSMDASLAGRDRVNYQRQLTENAQPFRFDDRQDLYLLIRKYYI